MKHPTQFDKGWQKCEAWDAAPWCQIKKWDLIAYELLAGLWNGKSIGLRNQAFEAQQNPSRLQCVTTQGGHNASLPPAIKSTAN